MFPSPLTALKARFEKIGLVFPAHGTTIPFYQSGGVGADHVLQRQSRLDVLDGETLHLGLFLVGGQVLLPPALVHVHGRTADQGQGLHLGPAARQTVEGAVGQRFQHF